MRWPTISYVQCVENRIEAIDNLLQKLFPNVDFTDELGPPITLDNWMHPPSHYEIQRNPLLPNGPKKRQVRRLHSSLSSDESGEEADPGSELGTDISLATAMRASNAAFDRATRAASYQDVGQISETLWLSYPAHEPVEASAFQQSVFLFETFSAPKRSHSIHYELPPQDLIQVLVNSWFDSVSVFLPILHRGLLEQQLNAGRHMTDQRFAALILLVCACSARYSHDSRVLAVPGEWHSAGWQYYSQVEPLVRSMEPLVPDLIDLQLLVLSALFIVNSVSRTGLAPLLVVKGISLAQKVGAHRNRSYRSSPNLVDELWKRAFWAMVCLDRIWSARFGRHCAIRDEDFDLDLPMPIDDEYWDLTDRVNYFPLEKPQPDDQPSSIAYFISKLKITQILAFATRSLYSISSFKLVKDPSLICQMDSALNEWLGELPPHLSWDPRRKNLHWLRQSAVLHLIYHDVQLLLHRPFMFSKTLGLPSLAICTNAARSSISIMENQTELNGLCDHLQAPLIFDSAIVLLLDMWQKMNATRQPPTHSQFADHRRHITVALAELSTLEAAYLPAGKFACSSRFSRSA
ncbi:fungal-specific transcription factor domain-containing protein [Auriculariales sp. MPI-PUGE-AT-0066]|nr:fungal-specific transcription factor domain-containing protein [Auriculariales sp. MPI-PUGE-AT-0066]